MKKLNKITSSSYDVMDFSQMNLTLGGAVAKKTADIYRNYQTCPNQFGCTSGDMVSERQTDAGEVTVNDICFDQLQAIVRILRLY